MRNKSEKPQKEKAKKPTPQDYERVGRMMEAVVSTGYLNKKRIVSASFLRGVFFGLGSTIGASIIVAVVLSIINFFFDTGLISDFFN